MKEIITKFEDAFHSKDTSSSKKLVNGAMKGLREYNRDLYSQALDVLTRNEEGTGSPIKRVIDLLVDYDNNVNYTTHDEMMRDSGVEFANDELPDLDTKAKDVVNAFTRDELKDIYGTDDIDLINAGKPADERVSLKENVEYCLVLPDVKSDDEANKIIDALKELGYESYFWTR